MARTRNRVFISCVTSEFGEFRQALGKYLSRADCDVKVQEDFIQSPENTLHKLDDYIRHSTAVIHLLGELPGSVVEPETVGAYLNQMNGRFLERLPALRNSLGSFDGISYIQWEAFIALHHRVPLFVYKSMARGNVAGDVGISRHVEYLHLASRYPDPFESLADLLGRLIGDLHRVLTSDPGSAIVTNRDEAARHQESYAARNNLERNIRLHNMTFVLIPPATINMGGEKTRYPFGEDPEASPHLYMSESILAIQDRRRLAENVAVQKLKEIADWFDVARREKGSLRLPTVEELRHAMRLGLVKPCGPPQQELCSDEGELQIICYTIDDATLLPTPVSNRNMNLPETLSWRLVLDSLDFSPDNRP
jgi:hypothetical protein